MGVGRFVMMSSYGRAILSSADPATPAMQYIMGQGDGGDGWYPRGTLVLERAHMDTTHFFVNATNPRSLEAVVYKNGGNSASGGQAAAATVGTALYTLSLPVQTSGADSTQDSSKHVILPTDYLTVAIGHDIESGPGTGAGTTGSLDTTFMLEGRYEDAAGGGIAEDGLFQMFHLNGSVLTVVTLWVLGQSSGTDGWPVDRQVVIRRLGMSGDFTVKPAGTPPPQNTLRFALYKNGVSTLVSEVTKVVTSSSSRGAFTTASFPDATIASGDVLYAKLEQVRDVGSGTAQFDALSIFIEAEEVET